MAQYLKSIARPAGWLILLSAVPLPAAAYLDPGTGSLILQGAIAAVVGVVVAAKLYWYRLKSHFSRAKKHPGEDAEPSRDGG